MPALAHDRLAALLDYPDEGFRERVYDALGALRAECPEAVGHLVPLAEHVASSSLADCEELFIATFELSPLCALEIGWQLYGDRYARGMFLVRMRGLMRETGVAETVELPDHLGHVLRVAARAEPATASKLARRFALPALSVMRERFAGKESPYEGVLAAAAALLARHVSPAAERALPGGAR